jgi:transcriptional regulator with XRE-family HTH domain
MKPVYQQLREYREARGITQTHIAKKTGKTVQRISALETGGIRLTADELVELCLTGYEISPAIFFAESFSVSENKEAEDSQK